MQLRRFLPVALLIFVFIASVAVASAWTGPSASPPGGNVPAPLNVGSSDQNKAGSMGVGQTSLPVFTFEANGSSLINGALILYGTSRYLNFGTNSGSAGYGFRDNAGVLEYKNSAGTWATFAASGVWTTSGTNIYNSNTGNVGIGTASPSYKLDVSGDIISSWVRTRSDTGWYNETHQGGWYMSDATWVRSYSNKNVYTGGIMRADGGVCAGSTCTAGSVTAPQFCIGASCITAWPSGGGAYLPLAGGTMNSGSTIDNSGRMHIAAAEDIYLLARGSDVYVSGAWGGQGNLRVQNYVDIGGAALIQGYLAVTGNSGGIGIDVTGGNVRAPAFVYQSDARLKKDVEPLAGTLDKVLSLRPVSYLWKDPSKQPLGLQIGFIAQDVEKVEPLLVSTDGDGIKAIDYARMAPLLVGSVQELNTKIEAQQNEINELKAQIRELMER